MWSTSKESIASLCHQLLVREASFVLVAFAITTALLAALIFVFHKLWTCDSVAREYCTRVCTSVFALLYFALLLDVLFFAFHTESTGDARSITGKRWFCVHWKPLNALGYRDEEISRLEGKHQVVVVGDSFAAGHGVDDYRDRFSNLLEDMLGVEWAVANLSRLGWDTRDELRAFAEFPYDPDIVVVSYYINDIIGVAASRGLIDQSQPRRDHRPGWLRPAIENSYLWDYVLLKMRKFQPNPKQRSFAEMFGDVETWSMHRRDLLDLIASIRDRGGRPLVVVWPWPRNVEQTSPLTFKVAELMKDQGVPVVDLAERFAGRDPGDLISSSLDGHPNREAHREAAELLMPELCQILDHDQTSIPPICAEFR